MSKRYEQMNEDVRNTFLAQDKDWQERIILTDPVIAPMVTDLKRNAAQYRIERKLSEQYLIENGFKCIYGWDWVRGELTVRYCKADVMHDVGFWFPSPSWHCMYYHTHIKEWSSSCAGGHVRNALAELAIDIVNTEQAQHRESPEGGG